MKKVLLTMVLTTLTITGVASYVLLSEGIVKLEKVEQDHERIVIVDGQVQEDTTWNEMLGMNIKVDVVDGIYVGR